MDLPALRAAMCRRLTDWPYWQCWPEQMGDGWFSIGGVVRHLRNPDPVWRRRWSFRVRGNFTPFHYRATVCPLQGEDKGAFECRMETYRPLGVWLMILLLAPMAPPLWLAAVIPLMIFGPAIVGLGVLLYLRQRHNDDPRGKAALAWRRFKAVTFMAMLFPVSIALGSEGRDSPAKLFARVFDAREIE